MIWDMEVSSLNLTNTCTTILQLEKSGEDNLTIKNVTRTDLEQIKEALAFYHKIHFDMEGINRSVQASNDLILELIKDKQGIVEFLLYKLGQFKNNQQVEKESPDAMAKNFRRKI